MLTNLRNAIRKKKIYFTIQKSKKNIDILEQFLFHSIITSFSAYSLKNKTFLIVFVNYVSNFDASISDYSINSKKVSKQQNFILGDSFSTDFNKSNFIVNGDFSDNFIKKVQKIKSRTIFR